MASPCDDCVIKVCCTEICEKKELYTAYYQNSLKYYQHKSGRTYILACYDPSYKRVLDVLQEAKEQNSKILERANGVNKTK